MIDTRVAADRSAQTLAAQAQWGAVAVLSFKASVLDTVGDVAVNVFARSLRLGAGVGAAHAIGASQQSVETEVMTVSAVAGGAIYLRESSGLRVGLTDQVTLSRLQPDGTLNASYGSGPRADLEAGAELVLQLDAGSLVLDDGDVTPDGMSITAGGNVFIGTAVGGDIDVNAGISVAGGGANALAGHLSVSAGRDLLIDANVVTSAAAATIDLVALRDIRQGDVAQGVTLSSNNGDISLVAASDIAIETVAAGTGDALLQAGGSVIDLDVGETSAGEVDVTAAGLILTSGTAGGIGSGSNILETAVTTLSATAGTGGLFVRESNALVLDTVTVAVNRITASAALPAQTTNVSQSVNAGISVAGGGANALAGHL
ncbi:MAG: hypothetical protein EB027_07625, partial [Actinobacteria bacterium]|nr:hypothetical protein [Actinomycetota bacterium]